MVCWDRADGQAHRATVSLTGDKVTTLGGPARPAAEHDRGRVARVRRDAPRPPRGDRGAGPPRHHRHVAGADRHVGLRRRAGPRALQRPQDRLVRRLVPGQRAGQPVRPPRHRPAPGRRPEHHDAARAGGQLPGRHRPRGDGRVPAQPHPDAAARGDAAGDHPAGRGRLHPRRPPAALAELAAAAGLQPPRGPGAAPGRVPRRERLRLGGAPALVRRDGGAVPGRQPGPLPADRVRHRRVGPGLHDHLAGPWAATAWARSPTWTRWCTTPAASRGPSRTRSASTRRTAASAGSTWTSGPAPR